jgi:hypothetical protein
MSVTPKSTSAGFTESLETLRQLRGRRTDTSSAGGRYDRVVLVGGTMHAIYASCSGEERDHPSDVDIHFVPRLSPAALPHYAPLLESLALLPDPFSGHGGTRDVFARLLDNYGTHCNRVGTACPGRERRRSSLVLRARGRSASIVIHERGVVDAMHSRITEMAHMCSAPSEPPVAFCWEGYESFMSSVRASNIAPFARACIEPSQGAAGVLSAFVRLMARAAHGARAKELNLTLLSRYSWLCNLLFHSTDGLARAALRRSETKRCIVSADLGGFMSVELPADLNRLLFMSRPMQHPHALGVVAFSGSSSARPRVKAIVDASLWTPIIYNDPVTLERVRAYFNESTTTKMQHELPMAEWEPDRPEAYLRELFLRLNMPDACSTQSRAARARLRRRLACAARAPGMLMCKAHDGEQVSPSRLRCRHCVSGLLKAWLALKGHLPAV